jgi:hypothetical protein
VRLALAVVVLALASGCGGSAAPEPSALPSSAVPELESTTEPVSEDDLAADFGTAEPSFSGFVAGTERVFQGQSHDLDRVVSRSLSFESPADANAYLDYFRSHLPLVYGAGTTASPIGSEGRRGFLVEPAACACHRAEPTLTALVAKGPRVTYLEINGGGAKRDRLEALLAQAP